MKQGKRFRSVSTKVLLLLQVLILPLNGVALLEMRETTIVIADQARLMEQNLADTLMGGLTDRMGNAENLLNYFLSHDADCIRMTKQEEGYPYKRAKYVFFTTLKSMANMTEGGDGYFYYMRSMEDILYFQGSDGTERSRKDFIVKMLEGKTR